MNEQGVIFTCENRQLIGIEHLPRVKAINKGVIIVVGGPQTRVGSHRLFVQLARKLSEQGITVFRFDYTGAGDSEGELSSFATIQADIHAAVETFQQRHPNVDNLALWGLCDAASAILLYSNEYQQVKVLRQVFLINPWVRQEHTVAKTYLRSYYIKRLFSRDFWSKFFTGKIHATNTYAEIREFRQQSKKGQDNQSSKNFVSQMLAGMKKFTGEVSIILSSNDLTADEFRLLIKSDKKWREMTSRPEVSEQLISASDHTFSSHEASNRLIKVTSEAIMQAKS